jgi:hypothetical protein
MLANTSRTGDFRFGFSLPFIFKTPKQIQVQSASLILPKDPKKISLFKIPQCPTKSAFDKNFKAKINSTKPSTTLSESIHEPDFGKDLSRFGKKAKSVNGKPIAKPKETMPTTRFSLPLGVVAILPNSVPKDRTCTRKRYYY